jgi:hypothetical protein
MICLVVARISLEMVRRRIAAQSAGAAVDLSITTP